MLDWKAQFPGAQPQHYVFPFTEPKRKMLDPARPAKGFGTAWEKSLREAGFRCRFHGLRHTAISKLAEGQASDQTTMSFAEHISRKLLERYSHIRIESTRRAVEALSQPVAVLPGIDFGEDRTQIVHKFPLRKSLLLPAC